MTPADCLIVALDYLEPLRAVPIITELRELGITTFKVSAENLMLAALSPERRASRGAPPRPTVISLNRDVKASRDAGSLLLFTSERNRAMVAFRKRGRRAVFMGKRPSLATGAPCTLTAFLSSARLRNAGNDP